MILKSPEASQWLRKVVGSDEYLNGKDRWCLWLKDIDQNEINSISLIKERVEKVREYRLDCDDESANKLAEKPHLFRETKIQIKLF
ncbi:hypothetical protein PKHYL_16300 [Psychrobacter sp. KH172YL61]|nr:type IIL restriction-modification enzyme MmeI [Psychrobacter sp. KH172YL61]BBI67439.1 hypothetical protein PKHYL_16300 [Psychrobacter sp. KH172YL61]